MKRIFSVLVILWPVLSMCQPLSINGKVINEEGTPIIGATVTLKRTGSSTTTDNEGEFHFSSSFVTDTIVISAEGYETVSELNNERGEVIVILKRKITELDDVVVIAYGTTTRRLSTGTVSRVTSGEISRQPVSNPLAAMQGRVPGLIATQSNGVAGSAIKIQVRGQKSITQGNEPLYIIDGIPYAPGNTAINQLSSVASTYAGDGMSPFHAINPSNIESIEVLKDADATAIYGSRGANGVVLITTKKGRGGKTSFTANVYTGYSKVTRMVDMMDTREYIQMRKEAFKNDGVTPNANTAPDLFAWDTTRYTDFKELFLGGTAKLVDAQGSLTGGNAQTQFLISAGYRREGSVFPGAMQDRKGSLHFNLSHSTQDKKFSAQLSGSYTRDLNNLVSANVPFFMTLSPNAPALYNPDGSLNWQEGGVSFQNPMAALLQEYEARTANLMANSTLSYTLVKGLVLRSSFGYNAFQFNETSISPSTAQNPFQSVTPSGYSNFGNNEFSSWIIEPQGEYSKVIGSSKIVALIGGSFQKTVQENTLINAFGYTNDALLRSIEAAEDQEVENHYNQYRYTAFFGRLQYNHKNSLLLNISGRRDGSSRFGPGKQFAAFGAVGAGYIFTSLPFVQKHLPFLSFGKIRGSYGTTGNDQISNYEYLDAWEATNQSYQNTVGLSPARLFNPDYSWELNRKWEGAIDLGFFKDAVLISAAYFLNRSGNQLINYNLPSTTGFTRMIRNFPAEVENRGLELSLQTKTEPFRKFFWNSSVSVTLHRNKLLSFPDIETSSYASTYVVGSSLSLTKKYKFLGIDPQTGIYRFTDVNGDGNFNSADFFNIDDLVPEYYGGFGNDFSYRGFQFNIFFHFVKQRGLNYLNSMSFVPGTNNNLPKDFVNRWKAPGVWSEIQRYSTTANNPAYRAIATLRNSDAIYSDASFIRLKNLSFSYELPTSFLPKKSFSAVRLYLQGQNLFTITEYKGSDPETQHLFKLPPLRTMTFGIQFTL